MNIINILVFMNVYIKINNIYYIILFIVIKLNGIITYK